MASHWRRVPGLVMAGAALLTTGLLSPWAQAQTTVKPFQIRVEVPVGFNGTVLLFTNAVRVPTNGALPDVTGTNWVISPLNMSIAGAPAGVTATLTDSSTNPVTTIPVNLNTGNTAMNTNLFVELAFAGTQASGTSSLTISAAGGVTNGSVILTLEVADIWNGSGNAVVDGAGNWSDSGQWLGGVPGTNDNVVFTQEGMQTNVLYGFGTVATNMLTNSIIDKSTTISSLRFSGTDTVTNYANLYINPGVNLAIAGNDGFSMLRDITYMAAKINVTIAGTNGTLIQTNENSNFAMLDDGAQASVLDMSGLGNLYMDVNRIAIGDVEAYPNYTNLLMDGFNQNSTTVGVAMPMRVLPTWKMALTNYVRAVYVDPYNYTNALSRSYALEIGRNNYGGGSSGTDHVVDMGLTNAFYLDSICVAGYASLGGVLQFLNTGSYALFRGINGGRMSIFATADAAHTPYELVTGDNTKCASPGVDFSKGTVDMLVDRFYLSLDGANVTSSGKGVSQTAFVVSSGTIDANTAILGYQSQGDQTNQSYCYATMTVSNTAIFKVNTNLTLGYATADIGSVNAEQNGYGKLSIGPGGTVIANNIAVGGVSKASAGNNIALTAGASLIVSNSIADATPNGALGSLSLGGNCSLTLFINGATATTPIVYLTNFTATGTGNSLIIGGIKNLNYPADVVLIAGVGNPAISAAAFDAGVTMPAGSGLTGTLSTSGTNTINIHIINRAPNYLVWRASAGATGTANWDYTSKVWLDQNSGLMTNFNNPDYVAFDDAPGYATNVIITGASGFTPTAINMTNNTQYYTFSDGGNQISGGVLNKYGTGTVEIDDGTALSVQLNQGALTGYGSGSIGGVSIAAGAVMNYAGTISGSVNCSGTGTSSGTISGTLSVLAGGVMTNSGTVDNPILVQTNALLYSTASGDLLNVGVGSSASPQVASGGTFINGGSIGAYNGGDVLYVNGTFEDLGGGSDDMTLYSVTIGAGGTFIPGGDGIGTTTINSDGTGGANGFPGAALLVQGSTTVLKVDPSIPANTMLSCAHFSPGASASQQTQNGCTLVITNVSNTPFSAGQSFQLFNNIEYGQNSGHAPFNTGSSTNTFPVIQPATPGPGLAWDLRQLWTAGNVGVISASTFPILTNSFTMTTVGGTNFILSQLSWDSSWYGARLENQVNPLSVGLSNNWGNVGPPSTNTPVSWATTSYMLTNVLGTNAVNSAVFYRLVYP